VKIEDPTIALPGVEVQFITGLVLMALLDPDPASQTNQFKVGNGWTPATILAPHSPETGWVVHTNLNMSQAMLATPRAITPASWGLKPLPKPVELGAGWEMNPKSNVVQFKPKGKP